MTVRETSEVPGIRSEMQFVVGEGVCTTVDSHQAYRARRDVFVIGWIKALGVCTGFVEHQSTPE